MGLRDGEVQLSMRVELSEVQQSKPEALPGDHQRIRVERLALQNIHKAKSTREVTSRPREMRLTVLQLNKPTERLQSETMARCRRSSRRWLVLSRQLGRSLDKKV